MNKFHQELPGVLVVGLISIAVVLITGFVELSPTILAISMGFLAANLLNLSSRFESGIKWSESKALAVAVALLGLQLNLAILMQINPVSLAVIVVSIMVTFLFTFVIAKMFRINAVDSCLLASGQAICGSAAIMAVASVIDSPTKKASTGLIIAVVNFLGFMGVFIIPWLVTTYFYTDETSSGFVIGNTLQSMGHVVAAGFSVSDDVGTHAVIIKMCRILLLIPTLLLVLIYWASYLKLTTSSNNQNQQHVVNFSWFKMVPLFIWGFLILIIINNMGLVLNELRHVLIQLGDLLFILAMVAIGLSIRLKDIWRKGGKLLLLGGLVFAAQIIFILLALKLI